MANSRNPSPTNTADENLFLDILNDAPLDAHRKPTKIYGSIFYCFLLIPDWQLVDKEGKLKLSRSWKVKTITQGLKFIKAIADAAKAEGCHPDLHLLGLNTVTVEIWTRSAGGVTENDFILAVKIDCLDFGSKSSS